MSLDNALEELQVAAERYKDSNLNEAQIESAFIRPFIVALGYNDRDAFEVEPQFSTAYGDTRKFKVDFAIVLDDSPAILIEVKKQGHPLDDRPDQLAFYVNSTDARFGIYTNGIVYKFFSDLDEEKKMDMRPFMEINLTDMDEMSAKALNRFTKDSFKVERAVEAAGTLKYTRGMRQVLAQNYENPDDAFIQWLGKQVYDGMFSKKIKDHFTPMVRNAFRGFVNERANMALQSAMKKDIDGGDVPEVETDEDSISEENDKGIITTAEEVEGWMIAKSIIGATLRSQLDPSRIGYKDYKGFFKIILDGKPSQEICRFYFNNSSKKQVRVFDNEDEQATHSIQSLDDIYQFSEQIRGRAQTLLGEDK